ncbi:MAG TPA: NAD(P)H-binding protein [Candidatus Acidoferrales bacterium]|nr:NAD(P)H-binding protein [Candidatus Acidoferrales bacterium]
MSSQIALDVVTGAFSFTGAAIAKELLANGRAVRTLTNHPASGRAAAGAIETAPLNFENKEGLRRSLEGADVLYNTYWVRLPYKGMTFDRAVADSATLYAAAKQAGVRRIVHISIANPSEDSPLGYYRGKALVEQALFETGILHAILRPTVIFGGADILINNIAWMLRRFPIFGVPNMSECRIQPAHIEDIAGLAVTRGAQNENVIEDAVGPEIYTFEELVRRIAVAVHSKCRLIHVGRTTLTAMVQILGWVTGDVVLTKEEIDGLAADLLVSAKPPTCPTRFSEWLTANAGEVGQKYANELQRHYVGLKREQFYARAADEPAASTFR